VLNVSEKEKAPAAFGDPIRAKRGNRAPLGCSQRPKNTAVNANGQAPISARGPPMHFQKCSNLASNYLT
jgi:hypothetical protein